MHVDEVDTDASLVRRLLAAQFPQWRDLPIEPVASTGTDNAIYRIGDDMAVRLPRIDWATEQVELEQAWLSKLAPLLPVAIPVLLGKGEPAEGYPWTWAVHGWLDGENPAVGRVSDPRSLATELAPSIRVNCVAPGWVETELNDPVFCDEEFHRRARHQIPLRRIAEADDVALHGTERYRLPHGPALPSGSTGICRRATCYASTAGSAPSSTSGVWASAILPAT